MRFSVTALALTAGGFWGGAILIAPVQPSSALVSDACAAALRAFSSAAQRGR